jgi:hypothetical protein
METGERFPQIRATTLAGTPKTLPDDLEGTVALVAIAFERHTQAMIDSWTEPVEERIAAPGAFTVVEVPMIDAVLWRALGGMIDAGMRSGIPAAKHDSVMTYYGSSAEYRQALGMEDRSRAYLFLLDRRGRIRWRATGYAAAERLEELVGLIRELLGE